jgi:uncharacterized CHY-type Zn-finger protein
MFRRQDAILCEIQNKEMQAKHIDQALHCPYCNVYNVKILKYMKRW